MLFTLTVDNEPVQILRQKSIVASNRLDGRAELASSRRVILCGSWARQPPAVKQLKGVGTCTATQVGQRLNY